MYGFLDGCSSPNPFLLNKLLISCFVTTFQKTGNMSIVSKIALFHINCYFIGKVIENT